VFGMENSGFDKCAPAFTGTGSLDEVDSAV
jgi:hypothetical protein